MRDDTVTREIRADLTDADKIELGAAITEKLVAITAIETEKSSVDAAFNARKKELYAEVDSAAIRLNKGYEMAQVGCDIRYNDPAPGQKSIYRMDTSQLVETLEMSWEEKQEELQFGLHMQGEAPTKVDPIVSADDVRAELDRMEANAELPPEPLQGESREEFERDRFGTAGDVPRITEAEPPTDGEARA